MRRKVGKKEGRKGERVGGEGEKVEKGKENKEKTVSTLFLFNLEKGFPGSSVGKESTCNAGDPGLIPGLGRFPREGISYPLQYSGLENSRLYSPWGRKESDTTTRLSLH